MYLVLFKRFLPLIPCRGRTLSGAELLYASLFCNGDVDVARTALTFKASSSLRGNRRFDFGFRLGAASVLLVRFACRAYHLLDI